eukprot:3929087-Alexandrium_andersonii.AAC.1
MRGEACNGSTRVARQRMQRKLRQVNHPMCRAARPAQQSTGGERASERASERGTRPRLNRLKCRAR